MICTMRCHAQSEELLEFSWGVEVALRRNVCAEEDIDTSGYAFRVIPHPEVGARRMGSKLQSRSFRLIRACRDWLWHPFWMRRIF